MANRKKKLTREEYRENTFWAFIWMIGLLVL